MLPRKQGAKNPQFFNYSQYLLSKGIAISPQGHWQCIQKPLGQMEHPKAAKMMRMSEFQLKPGRNEL
ncbi:hypothetical protein K1719_041888 [Acacia pycnantha]|nr:hypothetical protein K1719_041888 [Acacia pycnantha]